jgi:hypothetical protein
MDSRRFLHRLPVDHRLKCGYGPAGCRVRHRTARAYPRCSRGRFAISKPGHCNRQIFGAARSENTCFRNTSVLQFALAPPPPGFCRRLGPSKFRGRSSAEIHNDHHQDPVVRRCNSDTRFARVCRRSISPVVTPVCGRALWSERALELGVRRIRVSPQVQC